MKNSKKEIENKICEDYINFYTNKELSIKYSLHRTTIQRILKRNNIILRKSEETSRKHYLKNFNEGIVNQNDAYIFGLIMADGNLSRNCIDITLNIKDKQILTDISNYVYGYEQISYRPSKQRIFNGKTYNCGEQCRFLITSKSVVNNLKPFGLIENKSLTVRYPKNLNKKFDRNFVRGFFDGDGCICIPSIKENVRTTIVSNHNFCNDLKLILLKYLDINICVYKKTQNVSSVEIYGKNQVLKFCNWLYYNSEMKLNRKYQKYLKLLN